MKLVRWFVLDIDTPFWKECLVIALAFTVYLVLGTSVILWLS